MNAAVQQLLESTHCPKHGMEWEACCYTELTLELHNKVADLITTTRREARAAAFKDMRKRIEATNPNLTFGSVNGSVMKKCILTELYELEAGND